MGIRFRQGRQAVRKCRRVAGAGAAMVAHLVACAPGMAAEEAPAWMRVMAEIALLPDPLQAQAIGGIPGAPRMPAPRCVLEGYGNPPVRKCWSQTRKASPIFVQATLDYALQHSGAGPALYGTFEARLAPRPCTTLAQAERVFERAFHLLPGVEPLAGVKWVAGTRHQARLFGDGMQPLTLMLDSVAGCISRATLVRPP